MTTPEKITQVRAAMEDGDYAAARAAVEDYAAWFRSAPRTIDDVEATKDLMEWGLRSARAAKHRMAGEMAFLAPAPPIRRPRFDVRG